MAVQETVMKTFTPNRPASFQRNKDRCGRGEMPCFICGQPMKPRNARYWVYTLNGSAIDDDEIADGCYPISDHCYRTLTPEQRAFVEEV